MERLLSYEHFQRNHNDFAFQLTVMRRPASVNCSVANSTHIKCALAARKLRLATEPLVMLIYTDFILQTSNGRFDVSMRNFAGELEINTESRHCNVINLRYTPNFVSRDTRSVVRIFWWSKITLATIVEGYLRGMC